MGDLKKPEPKEKQEQVPESEQQGCTLTCSLLGDLTNKPTCEEMMDWLENKSGLSKQYFEKIVKIKFDDDVIRGLEITFDDTVNCFIAIRDINNRVMFGEQGEFDIDVKCPKGSFKMIYLVPETAELLTKATTIEALKHYGEIIELDHVIWHDTARDEIPTGDVKVYLLVKKDLSDRLTVGGVKVKVFQLTCKYKFSDWTLQKLWDNCKTGKEVDYYKKTFDIDMKDKRPGCSLVCRFDRDHDYLPSQRDVYEWLTKYSGLSRKQKGKIQAFKYISNKEYHIIFDETVNPLSVMQEIKNRKVYHHHGVQYQCILSIPRLSNVLLKPKNASCILSQKNIEESFKEFGTVLNYARLPSNVESDSNGLVITAVRCEMLLKKNPPKVLKVNGVDVLVTVSAIK